MSERSDTQTKSGWKTQVYVAGALLGALMGFLSAYLFAREAEDGSQNSERPKVPPTVMLGLATSAISLVRQIAETAKKDNKKK